jgi:hypothetical protein
MMLPSHNSTPKLLLVRAALEVCNGPANSPSNDYPACRIKSRSFCLPTQTALVSQKQQPSGGRSVPAETIQSPVK